MSSSTTAPPYEEGIARDYTRGTEAERLRLERLEPFAVGDLYEHGKVWQPWPHSEARRMQDTARAILYDPNHVAEHHGDWSTIARESCAVCVLYGGGPSGRKSGPPSYAGWERVYVQAQATIPAEWRAGFADLDALEAESARFADCLGRDIATFGLRDPRGLIRAPRSW